jgi:hypothetical protein
MESVDGYKESFEESLQIAESYLADVTGPLILIGVTDDTVLREHFLAELRHRLNGAVELLEFQYTPRDYSLLEGAQAVAASHGDNGHRLAVSAIGLEALPTDKQSEAVKLLNAQRNRLGEARLAVSLWLNRKLYVEVANKSYDFYSWASHTIFLEPPSEWSREQRLDSMRRSYLRALVEQNRFVNMQGLAPVRGGNVVQMEMDDLFVPLRAEQKVKVHVFKIGVNSVVEYETVASYHQDVSSLMVPIHLKTSTHYLSLWGTGNLAEGRVFATTKDFESLLWTGNLAAGRTFGTKRDSEIEDALNKGTPFIYWHKRPHPEIKSIPIEIPELLQYSRAVILGDPGVGKTTLLRYLVYQLARPQVETIESNFLNQNQHLAGFLPVFVRIGLYAQYLQNNPAATIADFAPTGCQLLQLPLASICTPGRR